VLRKYVTERWSPYFSTFKGGAPPVEVLELVSFLGWQTVDCTHRKVKAQIREAVFLGLSNPDRKIRSLCVSSLQRKIRTDPKYNFHAGTYLVFHRQL
jgi:hypothetical protein